MKWGEQIKAYLLGNRKGKAANRLERDALSDPFLYEAMEGYANTPVDPMDGIIRLERELENFNRKQSKGYGVWIGIAAGVLLLAGVSLFFTRYQGEDSSLLIGKAPKASEVIIPNAPDAEEIVLDSPLGAKVEKDSSQQEAPRQLPDLELLDLLELSSGEVIQNDFIMEDSKVEQKKEVVKEESKKAIEEKREEVVQVQELGKKESVAVSGELRGKVSNAKGEPLSGANVSCQGKVMLGTITDAQGEFVLNGVTGEVTVAFSFMGMKPTSRKASPGQYLHIILEEGKDDVSEVVVTGYTAQEKALHSDSRTLSLNNNIASDEETTGKKKEETTGKENEKEERSFSPDSSSGVVLDIIQFNRYLEREVLTFDTIKGASGGELQLSFVVNKKNIPSKIEVSYGFSKAVNAELLRHLTAGPKWTNTSGRKRYHVKVNILYDKQEHGYRATMVLVTGTDEKK